MAEVHDSLNCWYSLEKGILKALCIKKFLKRFSWDIQIPLYLFNLMELEQNYGTSKEQVSEIIFDFISEMITDEAFKSIC